MTGNDSERSGDRLLAALLALPLLIYILLPTRNFYWDGVTFAINIEKRLPAADLLSASHLLYALCGSWLFSLSETLGIHTRAIYVLQAVNSVLAGLCVILLHFCLRRRGVPSVASIPAALTFGFSATWWRFATDANAYVPALFFLLFSYLLIDRPRLVVFAGIALACAMLLHQLAILFLPVGLFLLWKDQRRAQLFAGAAMIPVALVNLIAYGLVSSDPTLAGFLGWLATHSPDSGFFFNPLSNALLTIRGTFRLFFGGRVGDFVRDGLSSFALVAFAIAASVFLWFLQKRFFEPKKVPAHQFLWLGVYGIFLFVWMPQNTFYRLFYFAPLMAILAATIRPAVLWLFVPVVLTWNFAFVTYPQSRTEFNVPLRFALAQEKVWPAGTPMVFRKFHPDLWTISYFNQQASWIGMDRVDLGQLETRLNPGGPLWLEATAYEWIAASPAGRQWLGAHERASETILFKDDKHEFRFHCMR